MLQDQGTQERVEQVHDGLPRWLVHPRKPNLEGVPNAFAAPFLDASKITKDTAYDLQNNFTSCTTPEWERFIVDTQEEWEKLQARRLANIQESGDSYKQDDEDDDNKGTMWEGKLILNSPPMDFEWSVDLVTPGVTRALLDKGTPSENLEESVKELKMAFEDIDDLIVESRLAARRDTLKALTYMNTSVSDLIHAIDQINR